jgi:hypothetical protein
LSTLSTEDFEQINDNNNDNLNATTKIFLRAISTTCKAMGHTEQAAKDARRRCFAMLDFFGVNSLFISTTPDDECSFRVRLYCKPHYWVSLHGKFQIGIICFSVSWKIRNFPKRKNPYFPKYNISCFVC